MKDNYVEEQNINNEQPEDEIDEVSQEESEIEENDSSDEMPDDITNSEDENNQKVSKKSSKKRGKPRNKRLVDKIQRLENEKADILARMSALESIVSGNMTDGSNYADSAQNNQSNYNLDEASSLQGNYQKILKEEKLKNYFNDLNDYLAENEEAAEIFDKMPYQLKPEVIPMLPDQKLSPEKLHKIFKYFPKSVRRLNNMHGAKQLFELLRLDGKLEAINERENKASRVKNTPNPTGVLNGGSVSIKSKKHPQK
jgi:hypothetical protein